MFLSMPLFSFFHVVWVRVKRDMENGVKQVLPNQRYFQKNAPWQQKQRKNFQTKFLIVFPLLLYKINKNAALLKGKWINFSPVHCLINIIKPLQRKTMFHLTPALFRLTLIFFFFGIFSCWHFITLLLNYSTKKIKKITKCK